MKQKRSVLRSQRKSSSKETHKSAIAEHVATTNHVIGWEEAKLIDQEADKTTRWLKEAIWIRSRGNSSMNKDEGAYKLNNIYDSLIMNRQPKDDVITSSSNKRDCRASVHNRVNKVPERN